MPMAFRLGRWLLWPDRLGQDTAGRLVLEYVSCVIGGRTEDAELVVIKALAIAKELGWEVLEI